MKSNNAVLDPSIAEVLEKAGPSPLGKDGKKKLDPFAHSGFENVPHNDHVKHNQEQKEKIRNRRKLRHTSGRRW